MTIYKSSDFSLSSNTFNNDFVGPEDVGAPIGAALIDLSGDDHIHTAGNGVFGAGGGNALNFDPQSEFSTLAPFVDTP